jgi:hypothetical protein
MSRRKNKIFKVNKRKKRKLNSKIWFGNFKVLLLFCLYLSRKTRKRNKFINRNDLYLKTNQPIIKMKRNGKKRNFLYWGDFWIFNAGFWASWSLRSRITGSALKLNLQCQNWKFSGKKSWSIFGANLLHPNFDL